MIWEFEPEAVFVLCFNAESENSCNPSLLNLFQEVSTPNISSTNQTLIEHHHFLQENKQNIVGLLVFVLCLLYSRYDPSIFIPNVFHEYDKKHPV